MKTSFLEQLQGQFSGILKWHQLDALWQRIETSGEAWYIYQVGDVLPTAPLTDDKLKDAIYALNQLLREEHEHDFCGIVYVNDLKNATLIKVYDPSNLGTSCGCGGKKHLPRWVISQIKPEKIEDNTPLPNNRKKWWKKLF